MTIWVPLWLALKDCLVCLVQLACLAKISWLVRDRLASRDCVSHLGCSSSRFGKFYGITKAVSPSNLWDINGGAAFTFFIEQQLFKLRRVLPIHHWNQLLVATHCCVENDQVIEAHHKYSLLLHRFKKCSEVFDHTGYSFKKHSRFIEELLLGDFLNCVELCADQTPLHCARDEDPEVVILSWVKIPLSGGTEDPVEEKMLQV